MTKVRIPPVLRSETGQVGEIEVAGATVAEVLGNLVGSFPALESRILDGGRVRPFVNVFLDGVDIRALHSLETPVEPTSTLVLLPASAGG